MCCCIYHSVDDVSLCFSLKATYILFVFKCMHSHRDFSDLHMLSATLKVVDEHYDLFICVVLKCSSSESFIVVRSISRNN